MTTLVAPTYEEDTMAAFCGERFVDKSPRVSRWQSLSWRVPDENKTKKHED